MVEAIPAEAFLALLQVMHNFPHHTAAVIVVDLMRHAGDNFLIIGTRLGFFGEMADPNLSEATLLVRLGEASRKIASRRPSSLAGTLEDD